MKSFMLSREVDENARVPTPVISGCVLGGKL